MSVFEHLKQFNVNEYTEQRGEFTYLSWSHAWEIVMRDYPTAQYELLDDVTFADGSMEVRTKVTINNLSHIMWLPVMDYRNRAIKAPNSFDINKARMRCLVKNLAMFGLGLYIYSGEDLPTMTKAEAQKILGEYADLIWRAYENKDAHEIKKLVDEMNETEISAMKRLYSQDKIDIIDDIYILYKEARNAEKHKPGEIA